MIEEPNIDYHKAGEELAILLNKFWKDELKKNIKLSLISKLNLKNITEIHHYTCKRK
jgi:hypothetical protein